MTNDISYRNRMCVTFNGPQKSSYLCPHSLFDYSLSLHKNLLLLR